MSQATLLIVDDEVGVRESLRIIFDKEYRILEADSFATAIQKAQEERPEIVLLDILLPRVDGLEILRRIKNLNPNCQVIMLTALNTAHTALAAKKSGAFGYVVKPFDVVELRHKVMQALGKVTGKASSSGT